MLIVGGCAVAILSSVIVVMYTKTGTLIRDIKLSRDVLRTNQQAFSQLAMLQLQKQQTRSFETRLAAIFPDQETVLRITSQLNQMAQKNKIQQNFSFGAEYPGDAVLPKNIGFNLAAQGTLADFVRYLQQVEQSPFFVDFGAIELNKTDGSYQINTTGRLYTK